MTPLQQAVDRLAFVTQYLRDELFLAGPSGGRVSLSTLSMQRVYDDLAATLAVLRSLAPAAAAAGQPPPGAGGAPAPPASGGG